MPERLTLFHYIARMLQVMGVFLGHGARYGYRRLRRRDPRGPDLVRNAFERLGGSYIKFGQILTLQIDTLPREYCDALLALLDRVP